jgi:hypothetical protein
VRTPAISGSVRCIAWLSTAKETDMSDLIPPMMPDDLDALIQAMERVQQLEAEVASLRLTDEERTAIGLARSVFEDYKMSRLHSAADEVLERLLERTK